MFASVDFELMRKQMIAGQFQPQNIIGERLLSAFERVPREIFLEKQHQTLGYTDQDICASYDKRHLLSPIKLAKLFSLMDFSSSPKILIIGFATGYSLALAYEMGARVYGIEESTLFYSTAQTALQRYFDHFYGITNFDDLLFIEHAKLSDGLSDHAAFDYILIEGGIEFVPEPLLSQLRIGGKLISIHLKSTQNSFLCGAFSCTKDGHKHHAFFETTAPLMGFEEKKRFRL